MKIASAEAAAEATQAKQQVETIKQAAAEKEAQLKVKQREEADKARTLAAEKRNVLSQLARAREAKDRLAQETAEEKSRLEMELSQQKARTLEAKGRLEEEEEDKLCCSA